VFLVSSAHDNLPDKPCTCKQGCVSDAEPQGEERELNVRQMLKYPPVRVDGDRNGRDTNDKTDAKDYREPLRSRQGIESVFQSSHIIPVERILAKVVFP